MATDRIRIDNFPKDTTTITALRQEADALRQSLEGLSATTGEFAATFEQLQNVNAQLTDLNGTLSESNETVEDGAETRASVREEELEAQNLFLEQKRETQQAHDLAVTESTLEQTAIRMQALNELEARQQAQMATEQELANARVEVVRASLGAFAEMNKAFDGNNKAFAAAQKALFVFEQAMAVRDVVIQTQKEIATINATYAAAPPLAAALTAKAIASGAIRVTTIAAQTVPKMKRGGILQGARHSEGGIQLVDSTSGRITAEAEGGEVMLTRGVSQRPELMALASQINQLAGGVRLEGIQQQLPRMAGGGVVMNSGLGSEQTLATELIATAERLAERPAVVSVTEINDVARRVQVIEDGATL